MSAMHKLLQAHGCLRDAPPSRPRSTPCPAPPAPEPSAIKAAREALAAQMRSVIPFLTDAEINGLAPKLVCTLDPSLCERLPRGDAVRPFPLRQAEITRLIDHGLACFSLAVDCGLRGLGVDEHADLLFLRLVKLCLGPDGSSWLPAVRGILTGPVYAIPTCLFQARLNRAAPHAGMAEVLADLLRHMVQSDPTGARASLRGAAIGSASFDVGALLLCGVEPPDLSNEIVQGGPKVRALLDRYRSAHGRLGLQSDLGPLETYLERNN